MKLMFIPTKKGRLFVFRQTDGSKRLHAFSFGYYTTPSGEPLRKVEEAQNELEWAMKKWQECLEQEVTGVLKEKVMPLFDTSHTFTFTEHEGDRRKLAKGRGNDQLLPQGKKIPDSPFAGLAEKLAAKAG